MSEKTSEKAFDPTRYLRRLGKGDYLEVKWRLVWLRTEHPDAVIETELMRLESEPPMAIFRAKVSIPGGGSATGWGQEEPKDFNDYLEKAETKAIGRALAALGYGTQFTEDFDFAEGDPTKVVDSPVERPVARNGNNGTAYASAPQSGAAPSAAQPAVMTLSSGAHAAGRPENRPVLPATEAQLKAIFAIARGAQAMDEAEVDARCKNLYGVSMSGLTRRQASEFIDTLKARSDN